MAERFPDYESFWPYYVAEHRDPVCRGLHFVGTGLVIAAAVAGVWASPWWFAACPLAGYGFAWTGHMLFEKNRPATFTYPLWSLRADFRMFRKILLGQMGAELERANALFPPSSSAATAAESAPRP